MNVKEIRNELSKYNKKELENIIIELYKRIPKKKKEEHNIDLLIKDANYKKKEKIREENLSFDELHEEIKYFLKCVDEGLYSEPNNIISKSERSGYRFKVKRYYKKLIEIDCDSPDGEVATKLLIELYKRLSKGSNYLLFANWETFRALGVEQDEYFVLIIKRLLYKDINEDILNICIDILNLPHDPYGAGRDYIYKLYASMLKDEEAKSISIKILNDIIKECKIKLKGLSKYSSERYKLEGTIEYNTICVSSIYFNSGKYDEGINYFNDNYMESSEEVKQYIILRELYNRELYDYWIKVYESKKIKYRDFLVEQYKELKKRCK